MVLVYVNNSYLPVIGVHEMHGRMHPNYWQITIFLVVDLCSSLAYFMMTQPLPIAGKLPIKTLVAKQLPTSNYISAIVIADTPQCGPWAPAPHARPVVDLDALHYKSPSLCLVLCLSK